MKARLIFVTLLVVLSLWAVPPRPALAAAGTFIVNSLVDNNVHDNYLTLREALLLAQHGTNQFVLGRALSPAEQAQTVGCAFDAAGNITGGCGFQTLDFVTFEASLGTGVWIDLKSNLPNLDDSQPTILNGGSVKPTLEASSLPGNSSLLTSQTAGNVIQHIGVANSLTTAITLKGDGNSLSDVWIFNTFSGVDVQGDNVNLDDVRVGVDALGNCVGVTDDNGIDISGQNAQITNSAIGCGHRYGIFLHYTAKGAVIANTAIYGNLYDGIAEHPDAYGNKWTHVSLHDNGGMGIDKYAATKTANLPDAPVPVVTGVTRNGGQLIISGQASAPMFGPIQVELYQMQINAKGLIEGPVYLGNAAVDANGQWSISLPGATAGCYTAFQTITTHLFTTTINSSEFGPNSCQVYVPLALN